MYTLLAYIHTSIYVPYLHHPTKLHTFYIHNQIQLPLHTHKHKNMQEPSMLKYIVKIFSIKN